MSYEAYLRLSPQKSPIPRLFPSHSPRIADLNLWLMIPALFVIVTVLAFNFIGDGMRDAADPY